MDRRWDIERSEDWRKIGKQTPFLDFDFDCKLKVIPPFAGAVARLLIQTQKAEVSVYLDWFDKLGFVGEPYWELYPNEGGETSRYLLDETDELMKEIKELLT